jgi:hypothetical protein
MLHYLYKITNLINNKIYIGIHSTDNLDDGYFGSGKVLIKAIKKYGKENFKKEIIEQFESREHASIQEELIVNEDFIKRVDTYNCKIGGDNSGILGYKFSDEALSKRTMSRKNFKHSEETKARMKNNMLGHIVSDETKNKLSITSLAYWNDFTIDKSERNKKISNSNKNKIFTDETKNKIRMARKKQIFTSESKNKMRLAQLGKSWYHNSELKVSKCFRPNEVPENWIKGRVFFGRIDA